MSTTTDRAAEQPLSPSGITADKATLYFMSDGLGCPVKVEASSVRVRVAPYAQFSSAVHLEYVPRGKRKARGLVQTSPSLLVLEGWGHPDPDDWLVDAPKVVGAVFEIRKSRYGAFDPRYKADFDAQIGPHLARPDVTVLGDYRGHNPYQRLRTSE